MNYKIFIIDDELEILNLISLHLKKYSYDTVECINAEALFKNLQNRIPDLIILDIMLPDMNGIEICRYIKNDINLKTIPIIILSARQEERDKILGLEFGADDYITKPFSTKELVARVKATLRSYQKDQSESHIMTIGGVLKIDPDKYEVYDLENKKIDLTNTEFKILQYLSHKKGWVFSREKLLNYIWGEGKYVVERTIDVHIKHLRGKLGDSGKFIKNVRGVGYKIEE